jgi:dihydroneopterin aldolase
VRDLRVQADIGVNADEIGRRQPLIIHAELRARSVDADELKATFDYRELLRHAETLAAERISLIETFARRLAEACLHDPAIIRAEIRIEKPAALSNGVAGVTVIREA